MEKLIKGILFMVVIIGLPILANLIVEMVVKNITSEALIKCVYLISGLVLIHFTKEGR